MKKNIIILILTVLFFSCTKEVKLDAQEVVTKHLENADKINALTYRIRRIDTFAQNGTVWNNTGIALIEKDTDDKIFGFSFYGKRDDIPKEYIYDSGNGFEISEKDKSYTIDAGNYGFIGSPGGQMVAPHIFSLDDVYKKLTLTENEESYILTYEFENDTVYNVTDISKKVELRKSDFFPIKVTKSSKILGNRSVSLTLVSDLKINENVSKTIKELKAKLKEYSMEPNTEHIANQLLGKKLPNILLPDLFDENKVVTMTNEKLILLDFWEVWCGPCIASFPKVENLKNKYKNELTVFGIVSEDKENAVKLVKEKGTTFQNLMGNDALEKTFSVNSWPRYFLVDRNNIIQKEYFGFSEQIEKDIQRVLAK